MSLEVLPYIAGPLAAGLLASALVMRGVAAGADVGPTPENPLRLGAARQMALAFQIVLYVVGWASGRFGSSGVLVSASVLGLTDVDALTYSMAKLGAGPTGPAMAAEGLAVGILSNTVFKLALAVGSAAARSSTWPASGWRSRLWPAWCAAPVLALRQPLSTAPG
jgi:uncharacterized membrane protein (DUF4010 family)